MGIKLSKQTVVAPSEFALQFLMAELAKTEGYTARELSAQDVLPLVFRPLRRVGDDKERSQIFVELYEVTGLQPEIKMNHGKAAVVGTKRPADDIEPDSEDDWSDDDFNPPCDKNCDQVRRMINTFIDNGGMKVGEFQKAIGVSSQSYLRFMRQLGPDKGFGCDTYYKAFKFFKKREMNGLSMPKRKKAKTTTDSGKASGGTASKANSGPKGSGSETTGGIDLSKIQLEGQETDAVEVYDTCDIIRRKINVHLRQNGVTKAAFMRDLGEQFSQPKKIQGVQLDSFRSKHGASSGCTSSVFYAAYCFFEKLRMAQRKPKSNHREDMEDIYGLRGSFDLKRTHKQGYVGPVGMVLAEDEFGRIRSV